ncbi:MAG: carbonic anhydrase family protein [Rubrivivax sp.]
MQPTSTSTTRSLPRRAALSLAVGATLTLMAAVLALPAAASDAAAHGEGKGATPTKPAAAAPEKAAAPEAADPIDKLRQRLAERLAGNKSAAPASGDLQWVARTAPPVAMPSAAGTHTPAEPRPAARSVVAMNNAKASRAANAASPDAHPLGAPAHWSYSGSAGPQTWADLKPEFSLCGNGQRQSPIDIRGGLAVDLDPVRFDYQQSPFSVVDNGHTVQVNVAPGNSIEVGGKRFDLVQFHFHRPSEERIDGRQFEMSLHLVHKDDQGRLAVVGVLFDKGQAQPQVQKVWNALPLERNTESVSRTPLELLGLLPEDRRYITYMGSLTTPPCSEGVQWIVMRQPVTLTPEQIGIFARIYPMNARPVQSVAGRRIIQSQ